MAAAAVRMAARATPGALACQKDSFLQSLQTQVLACAPVTVPGGKKQPPQTFYELELLDTGTKCAWDGSMDAVVADLCCLGT